MKRIIREQAREMRRQGEAITEIAKVLSVSKSSVSEWVRDIELTDAQKQRLQNNKHRWAGQNKGSQTNREKYMKLRKIYQEEGRLKAREGSSLHMIGCMLYWAEGAKDRNMVYFVNSDSNMMKLFLRFLREELGVEDTDISLTIYCHSEEYIEKVRQYWTSLLQLPETCLGKTMVKAGSETRRNILENGVCGLRVSKTRLAMHIYGAIQEYGGFEHPAWLF